MSNNFVFTIIQMSLARRNDILLRQGLGWLERQEQAFRTSWLWINIHPNFLPHFVINFSSKESLFTLISIENWMPLFTEVRIVDRSYAFTRSASESIWQSSRSLSSLFHEIFPDVVIVIQFNKIINHKAWFHSIPCIGLHRLVCRCSSLELYNAFIVKAQWLFFNIKLIDSKMKGILNLGWLSFDVDMMSLM